MGQVSNWLTTSPAKETVSADYIKGASHPVRFDITASHGGQVTEFITETDAHRFASTLEQWDSSSPPVLFVSEKDWEYNTYWTTSGFTLRFKSLQSKFSGEMEISMSSAYKLYEQIRDILCGPASNMKSVKTE